MILSSVSKIFCENCYTEPVEVRARKSGSSQDIK